MKWTVLGAVGLVLSLAHPAVAQNLPSEVTDGMYITVDEVRSNSMDTFEFFAGPSGGPISKQQFVSSEVPSDVMPNKPERPLLEKLFGLLDADSNGQLTLSEWRSRINRDLAFADQNSDGRITLKELANARKNMGVGDALGMVF
ncbi:hypothetical protein [Altericroceibacterium xinjiangense]|uniref:hypothetical protein n=1 Tax=Altericroceibacterium xinjiangense TaxID=762261 RepID=UPI000F7E8D19|nr:hypothetical protein [Altericroceibacterium xinjiangense]